MSAANNGSGEAQDRMLGSVPGGQALGPGPAPDGRFSRHDYHHPAAGWGAARSVGAFWRSGAHRVRVFARCS